MEIVKFEKRTWTEIPKQDNPAFDYIYENQRLQEGFKGRREHCLLICKDIPYGENPITKNKFIVIEVPLTGDVIRRGLFWNFSDADTFARALANSNNDSCGLHLRNVSCSAMLQSLKKHEGEVVEYFSRGRYRRMILAAVQTEKGRINGIYESRIGDIRLNYCDGKIREWDGFWTNKIERIRLLADS